MLSTLAIGTTILIAALSLRNACGEPLPLPGGSFVMGSADSTGDESPERSIELSPFTMDRHEITAAQYDSCVSAGACTPAHYSDGKCMVWAGSSFRYVVVPLEFRDPSFPVVCVTWSQAREYCRFRGMRLPTEAQWEYAARASTRARYGWGDAEPSASTCARPQNRRPSPVGSYQPNGFGLYDMTGNVWEWTADYYDRSSYSTMSQSDPGGPEVGLYRVIRGGGWYSSGEQLRVANRQWFSPEFCEVSIGFRCAK